MGYEIGPMPGVSVYQDATKRWLVELCFYSSADLEFVLAKFDGRRAEEKARDYAAKLKEALSYQRRRCKHCKRIA
jgi:hypothetical protein